MRHLDKKLSIEDHQDMADSYCIVCHHMNHINDILSKHFGKSHPLRKAAHKVTPGAWRSSFLSLWNLLDNDFSRICTDEQWAETEGGLYSNCHEKYKKLKNKI